MLILKDVGGFGIFKILFIAHGSCFPRSILVVVIPTALALLVSWLGHHEDYKDYVPRSGNPFAVQVFASVLGFAIVFRTNMALNRYWEAVSTLETVYCKWSDAYVQLLNYINISAIAARKESNGEMLYRMEIFRQALAHWFTLMSGLVVCQLRSADPSCDIPDIVAIPEYSPPNLGQKIQFVNANELTISQVMRNRYDSYEPPNVKQELIAAFEEWKLPASEKKLRLNKLYIVGLIMDEEAVALNRSVDKVVIVDEWVKIYITEFVNRGWLLVPDPVISRCYQELSHAINAYFQACKVTLVPFPFPFTQMLQLLLTVFLFFCPVTIAELTSGYMVAMILTFVITLGYWGLNQICAELENPFGEDVNDLPLLEIHNEFVERISMSLHETVGDDKFINQD